MPAITVVPSDPAWPELAAEAIAEVRAALGGSITEIEHIGSTSVPGLAAKPIIDLMAAAADLPAVAERAAELAAIGFEPRDNGMSGRLFFLRLRDGVRTHHLHVVPLAGWAERNQRLLRDHLRTHPADVARYAELKRTLAAGEHNVEEYTAGKTALIQELTDAARAARGLDPVPVWEN
jgi:GrpB-like predicted nucleotidyltransferase (UPF0157 family)